LSNNKNNIEKIHQSPSKDYENSSKHYDKILNPFLNHIRKAVTDWIIVNQPKNILDIGCGTGKQISLLPNNINVIGVDNSPAMLKIADKQATGKCIEADAVNLPFQDNKFDLIISQFALHEKNMETINSELKEIKRLLKPNGKFLIVDFDYPTKRTILSQILGFGIYLIEKNAGDEHFGNYKSWMDSGGLEKIISDSGWKIFERQLFYKGNIHLTIWEN